MTDEFDGLDCFDGCFYSADDLCDGYDETGNREEVEEHE